MKNLKGESNALDEANSVKTFTEIASSKITSKIVSNKKSLKGSKNSKILNGKDENSSVNSFNDNVSPASQEDVDDSTSIMYSSNKHKHDSESVLGASKTRSLPRRRVQTQKFSTGKGSVNSSLIRSKTKSLFASRFNSSVTVEEIKVFCSLHY